jgi:hypothetical protein
MTPRNWFDEERPTTVAFEQAVTLFLGGLRRSVVLVVAACMCAAALAGVVLWMKYSYAPEYVLRVVEPDRDPAAMPSPPRQLAEYVRTAVFTSEPLRDVMSRHGLYSGLAQRDPRAALESFREDIRVDVRENYFVEQRPVGAAPRSARLIVSYRNADPEVAVSVTRELGELVAKRERVTRKSQAMHAAALAKEQVSEAREALAVRRSEIASMREELDGGIPPAPERRVEFIGLLGSLPAIERTLDQHERREAALALGAAFEQRGVGMVFEVVDDPSLPTDREAQTARAIVASTAFVFGLPLLAIAVGAFSPSRDRT